MSEKAAIAWDKKPFSHEESEWPGRYKIDLIKRFRLGCGCGLREAKECIEALWEGKDIHELPFPVGHTYVPDRVEDFKKEVVDLKFQLETVRRTSLGKLIYR